MNKILNDFIEKLRTNQKLQCEFTKCKTLKQSYDRFMEGKCSYKEYENFFEGLIKKQVLLSDQDLEQVCGGISLKKMLAPITIVTMLTGAGTILANNVTSSGGNSIFSSCRESPILHTLLKQRFRLDYIIFSDGIPQLSGSSKNFADGVALRATRTLRHAGGLRRTRKHPLCGLREQKARDGQ